MEIKKILHVIFVFNNKRSHIEHIAKKNTKREEKKINQSVRGPQINQQRSPNIFGIFWYKKGDNLAKYQTKIDIKIMIGA